MSSDRRLILVCETPQIHVLSRMSELAVLGYRAMVVKNYVALYKLDGERVVVTHVFHQSQDYARYM